MRFCFVAFVLPLLWVPGESSMITAEDKGRSNVLPVSADPLYWLDSFSANPSPSETGAPEDVYIYKYLDGVLSITSLEDDSSRNTTTSTFGYTNIPLKIPMTADSHFPIASNSKLYTAIAIYQLHEAGKLDVDADIATMLTAEDFTNFGLGSIWTKRFCPRLADAWPWNKCEVMTLRHLLSMSSGIYPPLNCDAPDHGHNRCNPDPYFVNRGSIAATVGTFILAPLMFVPGTSYQYSNPNFILAAYFVEKYSGLPFRDYLKQHIFDPLGLQNTYYDFFNGALGLDPKRVGQYVRYYDNTTLELLSVGADVLQLDLGVASGTGGIMSTVQDHVTFWYRLFNRTANGAPLLSQESLQAILTPWNFIAQGKWVFLNGTILPVWSYYSQGTFIVCDAKDDCSGDHLRWIMYTGGTETVHTANLLDYRRMKMIQVWTSTLVCTTDEYTLKEYFDFQTGKPRDVVFQMLDMTYNNPMQLALAEMNKDYVNSTEGPNEQATARNAQIQRTAAD